MNLIANRSQLSEDIIQNRFIQKVLRENSQEMDKAIRQRMAGFNSNFWRNRSFTVTDNVLSYQHLKQHRFVDMRTRKTKEGTIKRKRNHPIHNKIVMGHYNNIVKDLAYGFAESVRQSLTNE
jgi:hypothetical protein